MSSLNLTYGDEEVNGHPHDSLQQFLADLVRDFLHIRTGFEHERLGAEV